MKSRRVHRVRAAQKQARGILETYRHSSRGLLRVFESIIPAEDGKGRAVAARAAHHLAGLEAFLPHLREAIRSCRYPGAENGDTGALVWGLWGQLSETSAHLRGSIDALERIGARMASPAGTKAKSAARKGGRKKSKSRSRPKKRSGAKRPARSGGGTARGTRKKAAPKRSKRVPGAAKGASRTRRSAPKRATKRKDGGNGGR